MQHHAIARAAARRSVRVDLRRDVFKANGTQVRDFLATLRTHRPRMTEVAYANGYRYMLRSRRATRQTVHDRMRELRHPVVVGGGGR